MRINHRSRAAGLVLGSLLALPAVGAAQEPRRLAQPDSIPIDLASALMATGGFGAEPQILVGSMPEWAMSKLSLPGNARVLGSSFLGTTVVAVVSVSQPPLAAMTAAKNALLAHGWKNPPPPPTSPIGGFRSAPPPTPSSAPSTRASLCGDQQLLTASATTQRGGATIITYRLSATSGYSICRPPDIGAGLLVRPLWPTLYNPAGSSEVGAAAECLAGNIAGGGGPSTLLVTALAGDALLDHYGTQLADSGWKVEGDKGSFVGRTWARPDSVGNTVETSIVLHTPAQNPRCREASMQVRTLRKP